MKYRPLYTLVYSVGVLVVPWILAAESDSSATGVWSTSDTEWLVQISRVSWPTLKHLIEADDMFLTAHNLNSLFLQKEETSNLGYVWFTSRSSCEVCDYSKADEVSICTENVIEIPCDYHSRELKRSVEVMVAGRVSVGGTLVYAAGGVWDVVDGRLVQEDSTADRATVKMLAPVTGVGEYAIDLEIIGGLEDGFGEVFFFVPGFEMALIWDPEGQDGSGLRALVRSVQTGTSEPGGVSLYDVEVPESLVSAIGATRGGAGDAYLVPFRVQVEPDIGRFRFANPWDEGKGWVLDVEESLSSVGHSVIGFGTTSASARLSGFSAIPGPLE